MISSEPGNNPVQRRDEQCNNTSLPVVGMTEYISVGERYHNIPAKVDTGADSSSIWASNINITADGALEFTLFAPQSEFYDGHVFHFEKGDYAIKVVCNSTGDRHIRYQVHMPLGLAGKKIHAAFTLADRSGNGMPVLIGRRTISNKFLVDVTLNPTGRKRRYVQEASRLTRELQQDPQLFQEKYQLGKEKS